MKNLILIVVLLASTMAPLAYGQGTIIAGKINGVCIVDGSLNPTLAAAVACAGSAGVLEIAEISVPTLTANVSIPAGVTLRFAGGTPGVVPLGNFNLTINGPLVAPPAQIFQYTGTGVVTFGQSSSAVLFPEWFGAKGDGVTDDRAALQNTFSASKIGASGFDSTHSLSVLPINLGCKTYLVGSAPGLNFTNTDAFHIEGCNQFTSRIQINFTGANTVGLDMSADFAGIFRNMGIVCGTSASSAPTVCLLHARSNAGKSSNGIIDQFQNVSIQGFSPWIYYNYRAEQPTFIDCQISENGTSGVPITISAVNTAAIRSPNIVLGGANSETLFTFKGATMTVASHATTGTPNVLLYLDEGNQAIQAIWWEGFVNLQGPNQTFIGDTAGATGLITDVTVQFHGNSSADSDVMAKVNGTASYWSIQGENDPPDSNAVMQYTFSTFSYSFVRSVVNTSNCFTATNAINSIILLDSSCAATAPNALSLAANTSNIAPKSIVFNHAGTTTVSPQSQAGAFTITVPAVTGTLSTKIASGTATMNTAPLSSGSCATVVTVSAPNALTTDIITWTPRAQPGTADRLLQMNVWLTSAAVNFMQCNTTGGSLTPNGMTVDWVVIR